MWRTTDFFLQFLSYKLPYLFRLPAVEKVADNAEKESEEEEKAMKELYEAIGYAEGEQYEYPKEVSRLQRRLCGYGCACVQVHVSVCVHTYVYVLLPNRLSLLEAQFTVVFLITIITCGFAVFISCVNLSKVVEIRATYDHLLLRFGR